MTTPAPGPGVQRTGGGAGGDPIPTFRISALSIPKSIRIEPGPAGAFERIVTEENVSKAAAQKFLNLYAETAQNFERSQDVARQEYYASTQAKFLKEHGAQEKIVLAKKMLQRYRAVQGEQAYSDLMNVLNRDAAHFGPTIALLAFCNSPSAPGGLSKGGRRYGARAVARVMEVIQSWLRPSWLGQPAYAQQEDAGD